MSHLIPKKAALLVNIPSDRARFISGNRNATPQIGDVVQLDQGFTDESGKAMVLAYKIGEAGDFEWELEVFESELGPEIEQGDF
ncbi:hypothetical protein [Vibrio sp. SCSIO 43137]|uniref:hypothetical protein n=1 Tax=Vibrio sp. SCSIO 43137 TaxID=3021011 RepID=UPI00230760F4|nr:hypothetical protein [Vibrio sp. SCSIO 43137]WCE32153.1 hypothetical protein PK654_16765 [Vibrio sp. SCSIO 43137]